MASKRLFLPSGSSTPRSRAPSILPRGGGAGPPASSDGNSHGPGARPATSGLKCRNNKMRGPGSDPMSIPLKGSPPRGCISISRTARSRTTWARPISEAEKGKGLSKPRDPGFMTRILNVLCWPRPTPA